MTTISLHGVKEFKKWLDAHKELFKEKGPQIALPELFPDQFMKKYTDFANIERLLKVGGLENKSTKSLNQESLQKLDDVIRERTMFNNWTEMLVRAGRDFIARNH
ncbi:MAG: hypothetical protein ABUK01_11510 [Leptospirales bacterium]